jgi:starch synthase
MGELHPGRISVHIGFDDVFARQIYAGADMLAIPSRYEPCGLTQMIGMRYGTVPVARATGGLRDTIEDFDPLRKTGSGFLFEECRASGIVESVKRALCVYAQPNSWGRLVERCMRRNFSWDASAVSYLELYDKLRRGARA